MCSSDLHETTLFVTVESMYSWPTEPWLRSVMVTTVDAGVVGRGGTSDSISGPTDRRILRFLRNTCDAVLVGAQTVRSEDYPPVRRIPGESGDRGEHGNDPAQLVIVSSSLALPFDNRVFQQSPHPVIIATTEHAPAPARALASSQAELRTFGETRVDLRDLVLWMREQGWRRIVCEGGRSLLSGLVELDLVDEVCLTVSPLMLGSASPVLDGVDLGHGGDEFPRFSLAHQFVADDFVFCRFLRQRSAQSATLEP